MEIDLNDRQVDLVSEGCDLAIRIGRLRDSTLIARKLTPIRHVPCASPDFLDRHGIPDCPEDMNGWPVLSYQKNPERIVWPFVRPDDSRGEVRLSGRFTANNGDIVRMAAEAGLGVILEPTFLSSDAIANGGLIPLFRDHVWSHNAAYAVYAGQRMPPRQVRVLIDLLAENLTMNPDWDRAVFGPAESGQQI